MSLLNLVFILFGVGASEAPPLKADAASLDLAAQTDSAEALVPVVERMSREIQWKPAPQKWDRNFTIRKSRTIERDGRTITFNKVDPPPKAPIAAPVQARAFARSSDITLEDEANSKNYEAFMFNGTVFDKGVTEMTWHHNGTLYRVFVSADLSFLHNLSSVETETTQHSLIGVLSHAESANQPYWIPEKSYFSQKQVEYVVAAPAVRGASELPSEAFAALDALLDHYEANKQTLWHDYAKQEARNIARKRQKAAQPPGKPNLVINFWKEEGEQ